MADDIVDRLTFMEPTADDWQDVTDEAADEIERLRAEIERLRAEVFAEAYKAELRALEIVRLRELVADWADWAGVTPNEARRRG